MVKTFFSFKNQKFSTLVPESCAVANGNCDVNANCSQNDDGSFNCECKTDEWWHGDGDSCDYKPCENGGCDVNADCAVTQWGKAGVRIWVAKNFSSF